MKILLFGGFGLLGQDIFRGFDELGIEIVRRSRSDLDLLDFESLSRYISLVQPDVVINAAGYTDVNNAEMRFEDAFQGNVVTVQNLVKCLINTEISLVHFSTDYLFNGLQNRPYKETDFADPINNYGWTKLMSEHIITSNLNKYYIVRTSWLFGNGGKCFPKSIIAKLKEGDVFQVVDDQFGCPTYTYDLAKLLPLLLKGPYGIYNIANSGVISRYEFSKIIAKRAGLSESISLIEPVKTNLSDIVKRPLYSALDTSKVLHTLKIEIRDFNDALKQFISKLD
jgi:dTDP-4-dehydrorhamnose reductase